MQGRKTTWRRNIYYWVVHFLGGAAKISHTRLVISPLRRQQSASFHSLAPPLHVLSHFVAKWNTKFNEKIASMPREVPPH
ncbi:hypothetical protein RND81_07G031400 [Saponaria officinalis]|uniref:Secreted protein n=1 Tax=Saponaria officinalis TaxID=3572 RepID=A0AAW1JLV0_SAPOF